MQAPRTSLLVVAAVWLGACGLEQPASVETGFETDGPAFTISGAGLVVGGLSNNRSIGAGFQNWGFTEGPSYTTVRSLLSAVFPGIQFVPGVDAITPDVLNAVDIFVITYPGVGGRVAEICALEIFVENGGALFETADAQRHTMLGTRTSGVQTGIGYSRVSTNTPLTNGPFGNTGSTVYMRAHQYYAITGSASIVGTAGGNSTRPDIMHLGPGVGRTGYAAFVCDDEVFQDYRICCGAPRCSSCPIRSC